MSYARMGWEGSDVYVFLDIHGYFNCCGCILEDKFVKCFTTEEMLEHLEKHKKAGHTVPDYCIERLKEEAEENDAWIESCRLAEEGEERT